MCRNMTCLRTLRGKAGMTTNANYPLFDRFTWCILPGNGHRT